MNRISTITEQGLGRAKHEELWSSFDERSAARAIMIDDSSRIALMHVTNKNYYKLPGGGVDPGESLEEALLRELKEEAGAHNVEILSEIGQIVEYREQWQRKGTHYCFLVKLTEALLAPQQTDKEIDHGYKIVWVDSIDEAIQLVESGEPKEYGQDFEKLRELTFLNYVKNSRLIQ